jgi:RimJ/RimL family protein N-acetyltransferase
MTAAATPVTAVVRPARLEDAGALVTYIRELAAEPDIDILFEPDEFQFTLDEEREFLQSFLDADNSLFLVAEADGRLVGTLSLEGGRFRALRHVVNLGISVHRDYRNRGVGHVLMAAGLDWAAGSGIVRRVELTVAVGNARAIHLYEKFGFVTEGCRRRHLCRLGVVRDSYLMARLL